MSVNIKEYMVLHNVALLRLWLLFLMLVQLVCRVLLLSDSQTTTAVNSVIVVLL
jgi:hypothetical protein